MKEIDLKIEMCWTPLNRSVIEVIILGLLLKLLSKEVTSLNAGIRLREIAAMFDVLEVLTETAN